MADGDWRRWRGPPGDERLGFWRALAAAGAHARSASATTTTRTRREASEGMARRLRAARDVRVRCEQSEGLPKPPLKIPKSVATWIEDSFSSSEVYPGPNEE